MATAPSLRFSLPALPSPPTLKRRPSRFLAWPSTLFSVSKKHRVPSAHVVAENRKFTISRSLATDGRPEAAAVPRSVPVRVAHELFLAGHRYLDVRTIDEFTASHVTGAVNIPYLFKTGAGMTKNPNFVVEVSSVFREDDEIIIGCQSGKRSLMAAADLLSAGFTGITDIAGGYSAWVEIGLPLEQ